MGKGVYPRRPQAVPMQYWSLLADPDRKKVSTAARADLDKALALAKSLASSSKARPRLPKAKPVKQQAPVNSRSGQTDYGYQRQGLSAVDQMNILATSLSALASVRTAFVECGATSEMMDENKNAIITTQRAMVSFQRKIMGDAMAEAMGGNLEEIESHGVGTSLTRPIPANYATPNGTIK